MFKEVTGTPWLNDNTFLSMIDEFNLIHKTGYFYDSSIFLRLYNLYNIANQQSNFNKDFAECGVFAGMSIFFTADQCNKKYLAVDSFEGLSKPGPLDSDHFLEYDLKAPIEIARKTLSKFNNVSLIKGWIPEALASIEEKEYSYVNIDVDLYDPTKSCIEYFWPRLIPGGVLICDDYGSPLTPGAKEAMLEFFNKDQIILLSTGQAIVYK